MTRDVRRSWSWAATFWAIALALALWGEPRPFALTVAVAAGGSGFWCAITPDRRRR